jgi:hypothetical protein
LGTTYIYMKLMYLSVAQSQIGNDFILLLQVFMKNKVVDSQNKVADYNYVDLGINYSEVNIQFSVFVDLSVGLK